MSNTSLPNWNPILLRDTVRTANDFIDGDWIESAYITNEGIRLIQTGNIGLGRFVERPDFKKYISISSFRKLNCKWVYPGDILICRLADPIGRACIIPHEIGQCVTAVDCTIYRPNEKLINPSFAIQLFSFEHHLKKVAFSAAGSTRQRISRTNLGKVIFSRPPIEEQHKIAAILDAADDAIRQTEALIAKLEQIKAGLLHDLLTCGIDENGELRNFVAHPEQFRESEFGLTPSAWDVVSIDSLAPHVKSGVTPTGGSKVYFTDGILFVRSQNVTFEGLLLDDIAYIDEKTHLAMRRSEIFPHDVLLNITGASIGRCCPVPEGFGKANVNQHVCAIRISEPNREDALLLSNILASPIGQRQVFRFNSGGNRQGLNYEQIRKFLIPWPKSSGERKHIALLIEEQENQLHSEQIYLAKLKQLKQGLMQDLLTGSVRVNEIILDLPEATQ